MDMNTATLARPDALDPEVMLKGCSIPKSPGRGYVKPGPSEDRLIERLGALEPCSDEDAALPPVCLTLTPAELAEVRLRAEVLAEAAVEAREAEQVVLKAEANARQIPMLERRAGEAAARAFTEAPGAAQEAAAASRALEAARQTESALAHLREQHKIALNGMHSARGALSRSVLDGMAAARKRAAVEFESLVLRLTQVVASLEANIGRLAPSQTMAMSTGWFGHFMGMLRVPSLPQDVRATWGATVEELGRPMLLSPSHPRYTHNVTAAHGWLTASLAEALAPSGLTPDSLLR